MKRLRSSSSLSEEKVTVADAASSIHHAAVHGCMPMIGGRRGRGPARWKCTDQLGIALLAWGVLLIQIVTVASNLFSVENRSCSSHKSCSRGAWCTDYPGDKRFCTGCDYAGTDMCMTVPISFKVGSTYQYWDPAGNGSAMERAQAGGKPGAWSDIITQTADMAMISASAAGPNTSKFWYRVQNEQAMGDVCLVLTKPGVPCEQNEIWHPIMVKNYRLLCTACMQDETLNAPTFISWTAATKANVEAMNSGDVITFAFASLLVTWAVVRELEQVFLASLLAEQRDGHPLMRLSIMLTASTRQFALVPLLMATVPTLTAYLAADSLSIVFNALAVLFVVEVDDFAYFAMISIPTRTEVEEHAKPVLSQMDVYYMKVVRVLCVIFIPSLNFLCLQLRSRGSPPAYFVFVICFGLIISAANAVRYWRRSWFLFALNLITPILETLVCQHNIMATSQIYSHVVFHEVFGCFFTSALFWSEQRPYICNEAVFAAGLGLGDPSTLNAGRLFAFLATVLFAITMWWRVRAGQRAIRESQAAEKFKTDAADVSEGSTTPTNGDCEMLQNRHVRASPEVAATTKMVMVDGEQRATAHGVIERVIAF